MSFLTGKYINLLIIIGSSLLYFSFIGQINLFNGGEAFYAESAREMLITGKFGYVQSNFGPVFSISPVFTWLQVFSMKIFGINEFAARFPNALCGVITMIVLFGIGRKLLNDYLGLLWVLLYCSSTLPFLLFKSGLAEPWFNLFFILGVYYFYCFLLPVQHKRTIWLIILSASFFSLAILIKSPIVLVYIVFSILLYFASKLFTVKLKWRKFALFLIIIVVVGGGYFYYLLLSGKPEIANGFIKAQFHYFAGNRSVFTISYSLIILFVGLFPASVFGISIFFKRQRKDDREPLHEFKNWMFVVFLSTLAIFVIFNLTIDFLSLCFFPITFFAAYSLNKYHEQKLNIPKWIRRIVLTMAIFVGIFLLMTYFLLLNKEYLINIKFIKDTIFYSVLETEDSFNNNAVWIGLIYVCIILTLFTFHNIPFGLRVFGSLGSTLVFMYLSMMVLIPRIEISLQNEIVKFCKDKKTENCTIETLGFNNNLVLFYSEKLPNANGQASLTDSINNQNYIIVRENKADELFKKDENLIIVNKKSGYIFLKRIKRNSNNDRK